ncbi:MAG TPA: aminotransferase class I/II-fold pyridoxal phosphate-dependent enzyme [Polyangiaceae bacterium]|nr:aminotransferase class I/II-fold pyridoxal phosphate-dependent enzyme [Polyangiaceae bacterium]
MTQQQDLAFDTLKVHAGYDPKEHNFSVQVPIYQTVSYELGDTARVERLLSFSELGWLYTRITNPTVHVLEQRLTALEGGTGALAVASGMAAVSYTLLNLAEGGGRIITTPQLYGGTFDAFDKLLPKYGVSFDFVEDSDNPKAFAAKLRDDTKAIFVETISNPNATLVDLEALAKIAHDAGIPLVVDNTFATPYQLRPFEHGADIVVYSATKGIGGHGAALGGVIVENGRFSWDNGKFPQFTEKHHLLRDRKTDVLRSFFDLAPTFAFTLRVRLTHLAYLGAALGPFDAYLLLQGLETLSERISKQVTTTKTLIEYLEAHEKVAWVHHPAAKGSKYRELAEKYFPRGTGTVFSFGFRGTPEQYNKFIDSVRLFSFQANVGDARSLIINTPKTTHGELTDQEQAFAGITPDTIRLSIGLEAPKDLIADLEQAFAKAFE